MHDFAQDMRARALANGTERERGYEQTRLGVVVVHAERGSEQQCAEQQQRPRLTIADAKNEQHKRNRQHQRDHAKIKGLVVDDGACGGADGVDASSDAPQPRELR